MAGPYLGILLGPVWPFDARAAWGQSNNDINFMAGKGSFDTDRWLARAPYAAIGIQVPAAPRSPSLSMSRRTRNVSANRAARWCPARLSRRPLHLRAYRIATGDGSFIEPQVSLQGLWNFDQMAL